MSEQNEPAASIRMHHGGLFNQLLNETGREVAVIASHDTATGARMVDSYNALAAYPNPAAVPGVVDALKRAISIIEDLPFPDDLPAKDLRAALAALGAPTAAEVGK